MSINPSDTIANSLTEAKAYTVRTPTAHLRIKVEDVNICIQQAIQVYTVDPTASISNVHYEWKNLPVVDATAPDAVKEI